MKDVKVLGSGCKRCVATARDGAGGGAEARRRRQLEKVTDFAEIAGYGIAATPGVVIDGKVVHAAACRSRKTWRNG